MSKRLFLVLATFSLILLNLKVIFDGLDAPFSSAIDNQIFLQLRLPLTLTAIFVGASLAVSSALLQVMLRNPLADPGIIGISSGASLFAAIFMLVSGTTTVFGYGLPLFCFFGALISMALIYIISRRLNDETGTGVILSGIAISTISGAIISWLYFFSDAQSMRNLTFWLMGSLHQADLKMIMFAAPVMLLLIVFSVLQGEKLNWLYFGGNAAKLAGLDTRSFNRNMLIICALLVGIAVSLAGSIAFVGLLVPHLLRNFFGHDNRFILPASALLGAVLLLLVVIISGAFGGIAVPVSMLTGTLGGPIFLFSIIKLSRYRR